MNKNSNKKAWRLEIQNGSTFVALYSETGEVIDYYKESTCTGIVKPRSFSLLECDKGVPQNIIGYLNMGLSSIGEYTKFIVK